MFSRSSFPSFLPSFVRSILQYVCLPLFFFFFSFIFYVSSSLHSQFRWGSLRLGLLFVFVIMYFIMCVLLLLYLKTGYTKYIRSRNCLPSVLHRRVRSSLVLRLLLLWRTRAFQILNTHCIPPPPPHPSSRPPMLSKVLRQTYRTSTASIFPVYPRATSHCLNDSLSKHIIFIRHADKLEYQIRQQTVSE